MDESEILVKLKNKNFILTKDIELLEELILKLQKEISYLKNPYLESTSYTDKYFV